MANHRVPWLGVDVGGTESSAGVVGTEASAVASKDGSGERCGDEAAVAHVVAGVGGGASRQPSMWSAAKMSAEVVCVCTDQGTVSVLFTAISDTLANTLVRRTSAGGVVCCSAARMWCGRADEKGALYITDSCESDDIQST